MCPVVCLPLELTSVLFFGNEQMSQISGTLLTLFTSFYNIRWDE